MNHKSDTIPSQNVRRIKLFYGRCSSATQNMDRQLVEKDKFDIVIEEYVSGRIPFGQREGGARIIELIERAKKDKEFKFDLYVHSLERLGRNLKDLTNVISQCSEAGVGIVCKAQGIRTLNPDGTTNVTSALLAGILSALAQWEADTIAIRRSEGIAIAKAKGNCYLGRKPGSKIPNEKWLKSKTISQAVEFLNQGLKAKDVSKLVGLHPNTISKVKRIYQSEKRKGNIK
jgi:DNA invertase Pin-like site-specific DNA recombinase